MKQTPKQIRLFCIWGTNNILNTKADKDIVAKSVMNIAKECVWFGMKDVFVSSVMVNIRRSSAFDSAVKNVLQNNYATHQSRT